MRKKRSVPYARSKVIGVLTLAVMGIGVVVALFLRTYATDMRERAAAPTASIYYGVETSGSVPTNFTQGVSSFEQSAGKGVAIFSFPLAWIPTNGSPSFNPSFMTSIATHGSIPMINWMSEADGQGANQPTFSLQSIITGHFDPYITQFAKDAATWKNPFFINFDPNMNQQGNPWFEGGNGNQPGQFVQAWQHVHDIFTQNGATNVTWVWAPAPVQNGNTGGQIQQLYPGDGYVDWAGTTAFPSTNSDLSSFFQIVSQTYTSLNQLTSSKPMMITEMTAQETTNAQYKATWIKDALSAMVTNNFPNIHAVIWLEQDQATCGLGYDCRIESSSNAQQAFQSTIGAATYAANQYTSLTTSPILPPNLLPNPSGTQATPTPNLSGTQITPTGSPPNGSLYYGVLLGGTPGQSYTQYRTSIWSQLPQFEQDAGKAVSLFAYYSSWDQNVIQPFDAAYNNTIRAHGSIPFVIWTSQRTNGGVNEPNFSPRRIYNGYYNDFITEWAQEIKAWGHPVFIMFDPNMNQQNDPWSDNVNGNHPGDYAKAWQFIHDAFQKQGATNVTWVWSPALIQNADTHRLQQDYPGDSYVDYVGTGVFPYPATNQQSFSQLFTHTYARLGQLAPNKPMLLTNLAAQETNDPNWKAQWITDALTTQLPGNFRNVKGIIWVNQDKANSGLGYDARIESSQNAQSAFRNAISSATYVSNQFASFDTSPITPLVLSGNAQKQNTPPVANTCSPSPWNCLMHPLHCLIPPGNCLGH